MTTGPFDTGTFAAFLDDISTAFIERDFEKWRSRLVLPFSMVTAEGPVTLTNDAEVQRNFDLYLHACDRMNLDLVHREPLTIETCPDGTVLATYRTHLLSQGQRATDPYVSTALMHACPDTWRMSAILNARGHHRWTGRPPKNSGE